MKPKFIKAFMEVAETFAKLSSAKRLQVGSVIVKDGRILSCGYNGMPSGMDNVCEDKILSDSDGCGREWSDEDTYTTVTKKEVLHAEANSILKCARDGQATKGATLFTTHSPCFECSKLIHQAGIDTVFYRNKYRDEEGINFLRNLNVKVFCIDEQTNEETTTGMP